MTEIEQEQRAAGVSRMLTGEPPPKEPIEHRPEPPAPTPAAAAIAADAEVGTPKVPRLQPHRLVEKIGEIAAFDRLSGPLTGAVKRLVPHGLVKDLLSGTWLGHPLHPLLTDVPIGSFTSATVLDLLGGSAAERGADLLIGLGLASSVPTVAAGAADWSDTFGPDQRVGLVHTVANAVGLGAYVASLLARRRGRRPAGKMLALVGMGAMSAGGYLGGYLSYGRGVGVNNAFWQHEPADWVPAMDDAALPEAQSAKADVDGTGILLYRRGGNVYAIGSRCTHAGGTLEEGEVDGRDLCVTCPWHQSVFRMADGSVVHGPATIPQTSYETRVQDGKIEVRKS